MEEGSFSQLVTTDTPMLIIIAIDQSGSMLEAFTNYSMILPKIEVASMVASALLDELLMRSFHLDKNRRYFDIVVLGYSKMGARPLLVDTMIPIPILFFEDHQPKVVYRTIESVDANNRLQLCPEAYHEWIKPEAAGPNAMIEMFDDVIKIVETWCENRQNWDSLPPLVINITDGSDDFAYSKHHLYRANKLKQLGTKHGKTLLVNVCIDSCPRSERLYFPSPDAVPPTHKAAFLANLSSPLPSIFNDMHKEFNDGKVLSEPPYLALCYNASVLHMIPRLRMATRLPDDYKG